MNDDEISLLREQNDLMVAVCAALTPPTPPPPEDPPARMTDADYLADLANIAAGRRADAFRQRQIVPGGSATPPGPDTVRRGDAAAYLQNIGAIAAGRVKVT